MARTARAVEKNLIYHVLNRGNARRKLFHKPADYDAFVRVLAQALERYPTIELLAFCLMPNHWHLVLRPRAARDLGRFMSWLCVTHVRRHHLAHRTRGGGHLYQGRFKSFPVQEDAHLLTLLRYVEANPIRAQLVRDARRWKWGSLSWRHAPRRANKDEVKLKLSRWPLPEPRNWLELVQEKLPAEDLQRMRECVNRGRPWGRDDWVRATARRLHLTFTLRGVGRPKKAAKTRK